MNSSELIGGFDFEKRAEEFRKRSQKDIYASRSWEVFSKLGFSDEEISFGFFLACDFPNSPGYEVLADMREESRREAKQAKRLIGRFESDRKELAKFLGVRLDADNRIVMSDPKTSLDSILFPSIEKPLEPPTNVATTAIPTNKEMVGAFDATIAKLKQLENEARQFTLKKSSGPIFFLRLGDLDGQGKSQATSLPRLCEPSQCRESNLRSR